MQSGSRLQYELNRIQSLVGWVIKDVHMCWYWVKRVCGLKFWNWMRDRGLSTWPDEGLLNRQWGVDTAIWEHCFNDVMNSEEVCLVGMARGWGGLREIPFPDCELMNRGHRDWRRLSINSFPLLWLCRAVPAKGPTYPSFMTTTSPFRTAGDSPEQKTILHSDRTWSLVKVPLQWTIPSYWEPLKRL